MPKRCRLVVVKCFDVGIFAGGGAAGLVSYRSEHNLSFCSLDEI